MLYDAGPNKSAETIVNYLKSHSVSKIDALILSHPDSDHIGATDEVIEVLPLVLSTCKSASQHAELFRRTQRSQGQEAYHKNS